MIKTIKKVAVIIMTVVIMISTVRIADQASSTTVQAASGYSGKIYKHWCKLRTAKSKRSKTIKKLSVGTKVTVLSTSGSWRKIKVGNKTGYALKKYVYISKMHQNLREVLITKDKPLKFCTTISWESICMGRNKLEYGSGLFRIRKKRL